MTWKKNFDISKKLRTRIEKGLLNAEDWKLLLTPERLFNTDLISSLPQNKEKKKLKVKFSNWLSLLFNVKIH